MFMEVLTCTTDEARGCKVIHTHVASINHTRGHDLAFKKVTLSFVKISWAETGRGRLKRITQRLVLLEKDEI